MCSLAYYKLGIKDPDRLHFQLPVPLYSSFLLYIFEVFYYSSGSSMDILYYDLPCGHEEKPCDLLLFSLVTDSHSI